MQYAQKISIDYTARMIKIICVCGARPNFMKIAPVLWAFEANGNFQTFLVHTGQHYDENMSRLFFDELGIPRPDVNLEVDLGDQASRGKVRVGDANQ